MPDKLCVSSRLRLGLAAVAASAQEAIDEVELALAELLVDQETARINPTKTYKPRRLKLDPVHRMARQLYKMKVKNPAFKRKQTLYRKLYRRKNKMLLKRRHEFVNKARDRMGLD